MPLRHPLRLARPLAAFLLLTAAPALLAQQRNQGFGRPAAPRRAPAVAMDTSAVLAGRVLDTSGRAVPYAIVFVDDEGGSSTTADSSGRFSLRRVPARTVKFGARRIGFEPVWFEVEMPPEKTVHVDLRLIPRAARLSRVDVTAGGKYVPLLRAGFYDRMEKGGGWFVAPEEVERRNALYPSQLLRGAPGLTVQSPGPERRAMIVNTSGCVLDVWVDGDFLRGVSSPDEFVMGAQVLAIEVYRRAIEVPSEFRRPGSGCGAVIIWTRANRR